MRQEQFERALQQGDLTPMWRYLVYRLGPDRAEDAYQDVLIEAFRKLNEFDRTRGSMLAWLIGFARNIALRYGARQDCDDVSVDDPGAIGELIARRTLWSPGDVAQGLHCYPLVIREALGTLSERDRAILVKVITFGFPIAIVAHRLDMTQSAVTTRLSRIRACLRPILIDEGLFMEGY